MVKISVLDKEITRYTVEFMGGWEKIHNPDFNVTEFSNIRNESGSNDFVLTVKQWVEKTRTIAIEQMKLLVVAHGIQKLEDKK